MGGRTSLALHMVRILLEHYCIFVRPWYVPRPYHTSFWRAFQHFRFQKFWYSMHDFSHRSEFRQMKISFLTEHLKKTSLFAPGISFPNSASDRPIVNFRENAKVYEVRILAEIGLVRSHTVLCHFLGRIWKTSRFLPASHVRWHYIGASFQDEHTKCFIKQTRIGSNFGHPLNY